MEKNLSLEPGMKLRVTEEAFTCPKRRRQIVGRTNFDEQYLRDGHIHLVRIDHESTDQIYIAHPEIISTKLSPVKIHKKFFEPVPANA